MLELKWKRKWYKTSTGAKYRIISIPQLIVERWNDTDYLELVFDGDQIIMKPIREKVGE